MNATKWVVMVVLCFSPAIAMAQDLQQTGTLHRWDYFDFVMTILAGMGAGGAFAAWVPLSWQKKIPFIRALLNLIGSNYRNAKNLQD